MKKYLVPAILGLLLFYSPFHQCASASQIVVTPNNDTKTIHEQIGDLLWILLLCIFSLLMRWRKRPGTRIYLTVALFFLLVLAAVHSHPLWSSSPLTAPGGWLRTAPMTRIFRAPALISETGLRLNDVVTAMAFDSDGQLWLSTPSNGPYVYSIRTNEIENLLRPDTVYGFYPDDSGMWVFSSSGATLYRGQEKAHTVRFPENAIPLSAIRVHDEYLFGTTQGLFRWDTKSDRAWHAALASRVYQFCGAGDAMLMATDSGLYRWSADGSVAPVSLGQKVRQSQTLFGIVRADGTLLAATNEYGILNVNQRPLRPVRFAKDELNMISQGASIVHRGIPCFGTVDGSIIYRQRNSWMRALVGESPVSALATNGRDLFAWADGRLVSVSL